MTLTGVEAPDPEAVELISRGGIVSSNELATRLVVPECRQIRVRVMALTLPDGCHTDWASLTPRVELLDQDVCTEERKQQHGANTTRIISVYESIAMGLNERRFQMW